MLLAVVVAVAADAAAPSSGFPRRPTGVGRRLLAHHVRHLVLRDDLLRGEGGGVGGRGQGSGLVLRLTPLHEASYTLM